MKSLIVSALAVLAAGSIASLAFAQSKQHHFVLVPGAFADASSWKKVSEILQAKGYKVTTVKAPLTSLADDVAATKAAMNAVDGPVVLVGHSWGGVVIGEAGSDAKVKSLVYVSAFAPDKGETLGALVKDLPPADGTKAIRPNDKGQLSLDLEAFPSAFAADLPQAEAQALAKRQIPFNPGGFASPISVAAWHEKPSVYVVTTEDKMISPGAQRFFAERMKARTISIQASHAGLISQAEAVAKAIEEAAS